MQCVVISLRLLHILQAYFLLRRGGCCQRDTTVIISYELTHILKTDSSPMRLSSYQAHKHVAISSGLPNISKLTFCCAALIVVNLTKLYPSLKGYQKNAKLTFRHAEASEGLRHNLRADL